MSGGGRVASFAAYFAEELRCNRERCGLSQSELAARIPWSKPTIAAIETARRVPPPGIGEYLDGVFALPGSLTRLAAQARRQRRPFREYADLESRAIKIRTFNWNVVPGLLQTPEYARCLLERGPDDVARALPERLDRQHLIAGDGRTRLHVVLDESVLYRRVGDDTMMRDQLGALLQPAPNVCVQVLPFDARRHSGQDGPLIILDFPDEPPVAYADGRAGGVLIDDPREVERQRDAYDLMVAEALSPELSADMIAAVIEERYT